MNTMTKIILSAVMVFTMTIANAQSKKKQIENLTFSLDSLNTVLSNTRDNANKQITSLNERIKEISDDVTVLMTDLTNLQSSNDSLRNENDKLKTDYGKSSQEILDLKLELSSKDISIGLCWDIFELDTTSENFLNAFLLLTTAQWEEVDGHYFDHYGAKKYSMNNSKYTLIKEFSGESGAGSETLYLMSGDQIVLYFGSSYFCEDYIDGNHSANDRTSYSIVYFNNQEVYFIYGEEKMECIDSGAPYVRSNNPKIESTAVKSKIERIYQFINRKPTDYGE
jgi:hypothetical protein